MRIPDILGAKPVEALPCGVYFLIENDEVVYIGSSTNIGARVNAQKCPPHVPKWKARKMYSGGSWPWKVFDSAFYILVEKEELLDVEAALIRHFKPMLNGKSKSGIMLTPNQDDSKDASILIKLGLKQGETKWVKQDKSIATKYSAFYSTSAPATRPGTRSTRSASAQS